MPIPSKETRYMSCYEKPRWLRDLMRFLPLKSQFVLSGNVRDLQVSETAPGAFAAVSLTECLHREMKSAGYGGTIVYDLVTGFGQFGVNTDEVATSRQILERLGLTVGQAGEAPAGPQVLMEMLGRFASLDGPPVLLVVDFASRLLVRGDNLNEVEHRLFANALVQSHRVRARPAG